jgi:hypothetical protein
MSEESRLGRVAIETAYALKLIIKGLVRVFFYLEDRERTLNSPTDKIHADAFGEEPLETNGEGTLAGLFHADAFRSD